MKKLFTQVTLLILAGTDAFAQYATISTGIMPFSGRDRSAVESLTGELTNALAKYRFIILVERARMNEAVKEIELGQAGLINETSAVKAGRIHGIQCMIVGSISGGRIVARALHTETQRIITTAEGSDAAAIAPKLASGIETFLMREELKRLRNDSPDVQLTLRVENKKRPGEAIAPGKTGSVKIGDPVVFHFKANRDGFLTIIDIQPGGDVVVLYPNDMSPDNRITSGREYTIPSKDDSFEITVTEPAGKDTVVAFFTVRKADWLDRKKLSGEGFWSVKEGDRLEMARSLKITSTGLKPAEWESATIEIEVEK
jgi:hypothetical protein